MGNSNQRLNYNSSPTQKKKLGVMLNFFYYYATYCTCKSPKLSNPSIILDLQHHHSSPSCINSHIECSQQPHNFPSFYSNPLLLHSLLVQQPEGSITDVNQTSLSLLCHITMPYHGIWNKAHTPYKACKPYPTRSHLPCHTHLSPTSAAHRLQQIGLPPIPV